MILVRPRLGDLGAQALRFLRLVAVFYAAGHVVPGLLILLIAGAKHAL